MKNNTAPLLFLMLPTYNRPNLIKRTIKSILFQKYQNFHLIIFNDGSTEDYSSIKTLIKNNPQIEYIESNVNIGINKARNIMLNKIKNEKSNEILENTYFCTISDDDYFTLDAFYKKKKSISRYPHQKWFSFNCESLSQEDFINLNYKNYNYISYKDFRKNYLGDKHFIFKMSSFLNIQYKEKYFKNGYEHIFYFKLKSNILTVPHTVKIIEYQNDGLSKSNLYADMYNFKTIIKHILSDPFEFIYYTWLIKKFIPKKIIHIIKRLDQLLK